MIGYCELCRRLGDLNECSLCGRRVCGSCMRTVGGKRYCIACLKKVSEESPGATKRQENRLAVFTLLLLIGSFVILYPKYLELEKRSVYSDFSGFVPVDHNRTSGRLVVLFENQINQPVAISSIRSTGNCAFDGSRVEPNARLLASCENSSATRVYLEYSVGGFAVSTSGRIPFDK